MVSSSEFEPGQGTSLYVHVPFCVVKCGYCDFNSYVVEDRSVHDVFLEVWKQAGTYDHARASVRTWMLLRLRSRALDRRKSAGATRVTAVEPAKLALSHADTSAGPSEGQDRGAVLGALAALSDEHRAVVELAYFEGLSSTEIAAKLAIPVGTVKSRMAAALGRLRQALGEGGDS